MPEASSEQTLPEALDAANVADFLVRRRVLNRSQAVTRTESLGGGVSSVVLLVETQEARYVVKQPLERLRVAEEWRAGRERALIEAAALAFAGRAAPGSVPTLVDLDADTYAVTMAAAPPTWRPWKEMLLEGLADPRRAVVLGMLLGTLHAASRADPELLRSLGDLHLFEQLRIDPYHRTVAGRHPDLAATIAGVIDQLLRPRTRAFVHGDFSPKNVLVGDEGCWLIDFEVAHAGNPLFDVAFMTSHLLLKSLHRPPDAGRLRGVASAFLDAYRATDAPAFERQDLTGHVGCLVLARVDGKSPVDYLDTKARESARALGRRLLKDGGDVLETWPA